MSFSYMFTNIMLSKAVVHGCATLTFAIVIPDEFLLKYNFLKCTGWERLNRYRSCKCNKYKLLYQHIIANISQLRICHKTDEEKKKKNRQPGWQQIQNKVKSSRFRFSKVSLK